MSFDEEVQVPGGMTCTMDSCLCLLSAEAVLCTATRNTNGSIPGGSRRKSSRWADQPESNHSNSSLLTTMERFVQTVDDMNETILVPCRLMDVKFEQQSNAPLPVSNGRVMSSLNGVDLFQFYTVLNSVKNDLMWGNKAQSNSSSVPSSHSASSGVPTNSHSNGEVKGHVRRPSTVSTTSSASASETEFSEMNEDSGVEGEEEYSQQMADAFHHHLTGLQHCLRELTLVADNITTRYNNEVDMKG